MSKISEKFDLATLNEIERELEEIHSIAITCYRDNPQLFDTIDHLARVAGMFCSAISQEMEGHIETGDPQGYIQGKLSIPISHMKRYKETHSTS
ncbi:hypothetical protein F9B85_03545 [Heliorestis acidaminivorans]|uniref:Uncharacterized protein n=1 Tax=Heliorestis acidaminivorans TaxID=553427 RepID=A0A6I0ESX2_9FIRM|nr:hypothetical protein [Heliorestis acidaminivorans]KAB2953705.1 hypothetical protein F9B85_03545 [Heliorestis acidaminivorans]